MNVIPHSQNYTEHPLHSFIPPIKEDKGVQTYKAVKTFRTIGTQTSSQISFDETLKMHPDDINKLAHLEDHNYSLGPSAETTAQMSSTQERIIINEPENIEGQFTDILSESDDDCFSDTGSIYCPSSSSDDSDSDDEHPCTAFKEKKFIIFES